MLVVIPISSSDEKLIENFCKTLTFFGPYKKHSALVVSRPSDASFCKVVFKKIKPLFKKTCFHLFETDGPIGWPSGPNFYWNRTIRFLENKKNKLPWLWMETDMIPVKSEWLDKIEKEYKKCNKNFMGCVEPSSYGYWEHLSGCAVYPHNINKYCTWWKWVHKKNAAFDLICAKQIIPNSHNTKSIRNLFRTSNFELKNEKITGIINNKIDTKNDSAFFLEKKDYTNIIKNKKTLLIHGCKDETLSNLIINNKLF